MSSPRPILFDRRTAAFKYALAIGVSAAAVSSTILVPTLHARPYLAPVAAVALMAWVAGPGPTVCAIALTLVGTNLFLARTQDWGADQLVIGAVFVAVCALIAVAARAMARAEREARRQSTRLEAMFGQAAVGIAHVGLDGRFERVNQRMAAILARTPEALGGLACEALIHEADRPAIAAAIAELAQGTRAELSTDVRGLRPDGTMVWLHVSLAPLLGEDDAPESLIAVAEDITERRLAEDALKMADRQKDDFLALLSHELRNPLAPIRTAVHLLRLRHAPDADSQRLHAVIERQVAHLVRLVDDLLDVSRVLRGKIELREEPLNLADVVALAVETIRPTIDGRHQHLRLALPEQPVFVNGDQVRLAQVVGNLLHNASKFSDPDATVSVSVARDEGEAVLRVQDSGTGIDAELLPLVFEPFVQADRSLERSQGGLGIGLTLVRKIIELHGGRVTACSQGSGSGSEFVVRLPAVSPPERGVAGESAMPAARPRSGLRVLVVDDNVDAADSLAALLRLGGQVVAVAHNGHDALARAVEEHQDVVLLDIGLPGMNGYEVAAALRRQPGGGPALIAITGYGMDADARRAADAGFDRHLVKPVDAAQLDRVLAAVAG